MTAAEFSEAKVVTDAKGIDKFADKYNMFDLIHFAQAYHDSQMKRITNQEKTQNDRKTNNDGKGKS